MCILDFTKSPRKNKNNPQPDGNDSKPVTPSSPKDEKEKTKGDGGKLFHFYQLMTACCICHAKSVLKL